jgi:hypothetical protein
MLFYILPIFQNSEGKQFQLWKSACITTQVVAKFRKTRCEHHITGGDFSGRNKKFHGSKATGA